MTVESILVNSYWEIEHLLAPANTNVKMDLFEVTTIEQDKFKDNCIQYDTLFVDIYEQFSIKFIFWA